MLDLRWLSDQLCDALRWQLTNPGSEDGPTSQPVSFGIDPAIELIKTFHRTPRVSKSDLLHPRMQVPIQLKRLRNFSAGNHIKSERHLLPLR
jgi:hypothetical protein